MRKEITFIVEPGTGRITVEVSGASKETINDLEADLGKGTNLNCGKPATGKRNNCKTAAGGFDARSSTEDGLSIWLYRLYHDSVVDGPGRRSVVQVAGCSIRCPGCYVPETHNRENGNLVSISSIVDEFVANRDRHDGVTILGGEPFDQPASVAELVARLKQLGFHLTVYTGYTIETLIGRKEPNIDYILTHADLLIDGPFVIRMKGNAGEYRGSRNQRQISLAGNAQCFFE